MNSELLFSIDQNKSNNNNDQLVFDYISPVKTLGNIALNDWYLNKDFR